MKERDIDALNFLVWSLIFLATGALIGCFFTQGMQEDVSEAQAKAKVIIQRECEPMTVEQIIIRDPDPETVLQEEDFILLCQLVEHEAGNQDIIGKRLVADVVLNRYYSEDFPNSISGVISQEGQFLPISELYDIVYTSETEEAVRAELMSRLDPDIYFYRNKYYHTFGVPAYQHGDHYFSGR